MISTLIRNRTRALCFGLLLSGATVVATDTTPINSVALDTASTLINNTHEHVKTYLETVYPEWITDLDKALVELIGLHMTALQDIDDTFIAKFEEFCTASNIAGHEGYAHLVKILYPSDASRLSWIKHYINDIRARIAAHQARQAFKKALFSPAAYKAAWDALWTADSITAGLTTVWKDHKAAVLGTTVVVASVVTAIACRNKIKAGFNKLFGKKEQPEDAEAENA